jgi:hypothetical protein
MMSDRHDNGMGEFDSAWRKWHWAAVHAATYEAEVAAFGSDAVRQPTIKCRAEYVARRHGFAVIVDEVTPMPTTLSLRLGDIAHNYRSALDHLAWSLVARGAKRGALTEAQERRVAFPISRSRADFNQQVARCLPGVPRHEIAVVRRYQVFQRGKTLAPLHALTILAKLSNDDKHRQIQPVPVSPTRGGYKITDIQDCEVTRSPNYGVAKPLEVGTELWLIGVRRTGAQPQLSVEVVYDAQPRLGATTVINWLDEAKATIRRLLCEFGPPVPMSE